MNTTTPYPRHRFTAETFRSLDQLYTAAARMMQRSRRYMEAGNIARSCRAEEAAYRLQTRAFTRGMLALTKRELTRLCDIHADEAAARKAKAAAKSAPAPLHIQIENGISTHVAA